MGFEKGHKKIGGRKPGTRNKRTVDFFASLEEHDFDPAKALIECYRQAQEVYQNYAIIYRALIISKEMSGNPFPVEDKCHVYLKIAMDAAKELSSYAYPKLKNIEHTKPNPLEHLSPQEKLELMKQAVAYLEGQKPTGG